MEYFNPNNYWQQSLYDPYKGLSDDERMKAGCMQGAAFVVMLIVGLLLCALLGSCTTTRYATNTEHRTDTLRQTVHQRDSIYFADSIYVSDFVRGDTVWSIRDRWHTRYVERTVQDTTYISRTDTLQLAYETVREVEHKRSTTEWVLMLAGIVSLIVLFAYAVNKLKRYLPGNGG